MTAYTVQEGDSLWKIAEKVFGDGRRYKELAALNGIKNHNMIREGVQLRLPDPVPTPRIRPDPASIVNPNLSASALPASGAATGMSRPPGPDFSEANPSQASTASMSPGGLQGETWRAADQRDWQMRGIEPQTNPDFAGESIPADPRSAGPLQSALIAKLQQRGDLIQPTAPGENMTPGRSMADILMGKREQILASQANMPRQPDPRVIRALMER